MSRRKRKTAFSRPKPKGMFLGGLFGGNGGGSSSMSTTNAQTNTTIDPGGNYYPLEQSVLGQGQQLLNRAYQPYDESQRFAQMNPDQIAAQNGIRANQQAWRPNYTEAGGAFTNATSGANNVGTAGAGAFAQAGAGPGGLGAANPYLNQASGSWTDPGTSQQWMNPYNSAVTDQIAQLGARNLSENILPQINDVFTGGGTAAQFGRERHADLTGRAVRDTGQSILNAQTNALQQGYGQAQTAFGNEQNRLAGIGSTAGGLGVSDINARTGLGSAQTGAAAQGVASQIGAGTASQGLGTAVSGAGYNDLQALGLSGQFQQQQQQQQKDFGYQQNREAFNYPFTNASMAQSLGQGWQLPTQTNSNSTTYGQTQQTPASGSPFGQILGAGLGIASLGTGGGGTLGGAAANWLGGQFAQGGSVPSKRKTAFGVGGQVPVTKAIRQRTQMRQPAMAMRAQRMQGAGQMPGQTPGVMPPKALAFARGGDVAQDKRLVTKGVHQHERNMHAGKRPTKLAFADGGEVDDMMLDDLGYTGQYLRGRPTGRNPDAPRAEDYGQGYSGMNPPSWLERTGRSAFGSARDFAEQLPGAFADTAYNMLPTVAYDNMIDATRRLPKSVRDRDWLGAGGDAADLVLNALGFMPSAGAAKGMRAFGRR